MAAGSDPERAIRLHHELGDFKEAVGVAILAFGREMFAFFHGILGEQDAADASSELWEAVLKATADIVPGNTVRTINMSVKPYDGEWTVGEEKRFWIGSREGAWLAFRTSGPVVVQRVAPD